MKAKIYHIIVLVIVLASASGCEKEIPISPDDSAPKVVLNAIINCTSEANSVKLSESVPLFSAAEASRIENPNLQLKINGLDKEITFDTYKDIHSYYRFTEPLSPGDKVEIGGYTSKHGAFSGFDNVPFPAEIVSVSTEWFRGKVNDVSYLRTLIKIKDNPDAKNYYRIVIRDKTLFDSGTDESTIPWNLQEVYVDQEILFNNITGIGGDDDHIYRVFPDDLFQGKEYTLNVYIRKDRFNTSDFESVRHLVKVEIHALSENLYKYLRSLELSSAEDNFQEPVKIFSNVNGGYGIVGIYNVSDKVVEVEK
jgi:hypothetical protein